MTMVKNGTTLKNSCCVIFFSIKFIFKEYIQRFNFVLLSYYIQILNVSIYYSLNCYKLIITDIFHITYSDISFEKWKTIHFS